MAPSAIRRSSSEGSRSPVRGAAGAFAHFGVAFATLLGCGGPAASRPTARTNAAPPALVPVAITKPASTPPAIEPPMRFLAVPPAPPRTGCRFEGPAFQGTAELALDAADPKAVFGDVTEAQKTALQFGDGSDTVVRAHLEISGFAFDVYAAHVALFATARMTYQGVFEPYARTLLDARAATATTLQIAPGEWDAKDAPVFENRTPWTVPCTRLGLTEAKFEVPVAEKNLGLAYSLQKGVVLATRPGGPPVVKLGPQVIVAVLHFEGAHAYVEWASDHGRYRGFVPKKDIDLGAGGIGHGSGAGYGNGVSSCRDTSLLYVVHDAGTAHLVGTVLPRTHVTFSPAAESRPPAMDEGKLTFLRPPYPLKLRAGYRLAIATAPPGSCRARPVESPPP